MPFSPSFATLPSPTAPLPPSEMKLDSLSLGVGVGIGVVGMVLVTIVIVSLLVCLKCKPGADSQRKPSGGNLLCNWVKGKSLIGKG